MQFLLPTLSPLEPDANTKKNIPPHISLTNSIPHANLILCATPSRPPPPRLVAATYIIIATLGFSIVPLAIGLSNGQSNLALSFVLLRTGEIILMFFLLQRFLVKIYKNSPKNGKKNYFSPKKENCKNPSDAVKPTVRGLIWEYYKKDNWKILYDKNQKGALSNFWNQYALIIVAIGGLDYLFFIWSLNYLNIAISAIILELWLVVFVLLRYYTIKKGKANGDETEAGKEIEISGSIWFLLLMAVIGIVYINRSHISITQSVNFNGIILIILGTILGAVRIERSIYWSEKMESQSQNKDFRAHKKGSEEEEKFKWTIIFVFIGAIMVNILTVVLLLISQIVQIILGNNLNLSFTSNQTVWFANEVGWILCIIGGFSITIGMWCFRAGNLKTKTLDINGIYYLTPVLSLVWLMFFDLIQLERWDYFVIGALIIIVVSILVSIEAYTNRQGFRWLIISLWIIGLMVYFREEWINLPWLADGTPWEWSIESVDYYSLIVLSATIFILILSFRISRLIERTNNEENQYLRMKHILNTINSIAHKSLISKLKVEVENIDKTDAKDIATIKHQFNKLFAKLTEQTNTNETESLYDLKLDFDLLCRSKQRGRYLAENLVLYIFSLATIMITIGTRPPVFSNWNALIIDILAFLFASAICFMTINLIDLRLYRESPTVEHVEHESGTLKKSDDYFNQTAVQVISIILAIVISLSFIVLLYDKWMGIWFI